MSNVSYTADSIEVLSGLDPVKRRPGMYTDTTRPNHLAQEVIDNSVDEAIAGFARQLDIHLYKDNSLSVEDDGRGMPVDIHAEEGVSGVDDGYITDLSVDWNIVGLPDDESLAKEDIIVTYDGSDYNWTQATTNDNPTGSPILLSFVYDWDRDGQSYGFTDTLSPGFGYWMLSYYDCTLKREVV